MTEIDNELRTKFPILLVHGLGFRDRKQLNYWGRIPRVLQNKGAVIFYGNQDANGSIVTNAEYLKNRIDEITSDGKIKKVNVIAHSKGGLDMRYAISQLGLEDKVASLTTISTPHKGSKTIDYLLGLPNILVKIVCAITDCWMRLCGDKKPNTYEVIKQFSREAAIKFNEANKDMEGVYYQSYAFVMKNSFSDVLMMIPHFIVNIIEGENDGLLSPNAVKWGEFQGIYRSNSNRGISHCDEVDLRRHKFTRKKGENISEITDFYVMLVKQLKQKNF